MINYYDGSKNQVYRVGSDQAYTLYFSYSKITDQGVADFEYLYDYTFSS